MREGNEKDCWYSSWGVIPVVKQLWVRRRTRAFVTSIATISQGRDKREQLRVRKRSKQRSNHTRATTTTARVTIANTTRQSKIHTSCDGVEATNEWAGESAACSARVFFSSRSNSCWITTSSSSTCSNSCIIMCFKVFRVTSSFESATRTSAGSNPPNLFVMHK